MSKINRVNEQESYNVTVDWLKTFAQSMENHIPPMVRGHKEKFATIEEKMNDLRDRIGFSELKKITEDQSQSLVAEAAKKVKKTNKKSKNQNEIKGLVAFIEDVIQKNPHFSYLEIVAKCRENDSLDFDSIRVNDKRLKEVIEKKLNPRKKESPKYIHPEPDNNPDPLDEIASYFRSSIT